MDMIQGIMLVAQIRRFFKEELTIAKNEQWQKNFTEPDWVKEIINDAFNAKLNELKTLETREDFENFIQSCGYRMSLEDWEAYYEKEDEE